MQTTSVSSIIRNGIFLETKRLLLKPLTYQQLQHYVKCDGSLEATLGLNPSSRIITADLKEAFEQTILPNVADESKNYLFATLWTAISKEDNQMIGDICMYGAPNPAGEVEIGYGTYEAFQHKGFMTEIVNAMIAWIKTQPGIQSILAATDKGNTASFRVLEKNGFLKQREAGNLLHWKYSIC